MLKVSWFSCSTEKSLPVSLRKYLYNVLAAWLVQEAVALHRIAAQGWMSLRTSLCCLLSIPSTICLIWYLHQLYVLKTAWPPYFGKFIPELSSVSGLNASGGLRFVPLKASLARLALM